MLKALKKKALEIDEDIKTIEHLKITATIRYHYARCNCDPEIANALLFKYQKISIEHKKLKEESAKIRKQYSDLYEESSQNKNFIYKIFNTILN